MPSRRSWLLNEVLRTLSFGVAVAVVYGLLNEASFATSLRMGVFGAIGWFAVALFLRFVGGYPPPDGRS